MKDVMDSGENVERASRPDILSPEGGEVEWNTLESVSRRDATRRDVTRRDATRRDKTRQEPWRMSIEACRESGRNKERWLEAQRGTRPRKRGSGSGKAKERTGSLVLCCQDPTRGSKQDRARTIEGSVEIRRKTRPEKER